MNFEIVSDMSTNTSKFSTTNETQFAICVQNADYSASLELHRIYQVVPDADAVENEDIRIIDESGEDYLYPLDYFILIELSLEKKRLLNKS